MVFMLIHTGAEPFSKIKLKEHAQNYKCLRCSTPFRMMMGDQRCSKRPQLKALQEYKIKVKAFT